MQEYAKICKNTQEQFACCDSCTQLKKSLGHLQVANKCTQLQTVGVVGVEVGLNLKYKKLETSCPSPYRQNTDSQDRIQTVPAATAEKR